jgi:hypothetical protein
VKGSSPPRSIREKGKFERFAGWLRPSFIGRGGSALFSRIIVPVVFAALSLFVIFGGGYRLFIHYPVVKDGVCALAGTNTATGGDFSTKNPCFKTTIWLDASKRYEVTLTGDDTWKGAVERSRLRSDPLCLRDYPDSSWKDAGKYPATFKGLNCILTRFRPGFLVGLPARRHLAFPWFTLVGEVGKDSGDVFPLNQEHFVFRPQASGTLYLHVNDAIGVWPFERWRFYDNNAGEARVVFEREGEQQSGMDQAAPDVPTISIVELKDDG